jgi:transcriptional regulator with XRE-family HTH domain
MVLTLTVMEQIHPLRAFREKQVPPLSQEQLADLLGVSRVTVNRWESGARKPEPEELPGISAKTGISPAELRPDLAVLLNPPVPDGDLQDEAPSAETDEAAA